MGASCTTVCPTVKALRHEGSWQPGRAVVRSSGGQACCQGGMGTSRLWERLRGTGRGEPGPSAPHPASADHGLPAASPRLLAPPVRGRGYGLHTLIRENRWRGFGPWGVALGQLPHPRRVSMPPARDSFMMQCMKGLRGMPGSAEASCG
jgi:hypothetical protein